MGDPQDIVSVLIALIAFVVSKEVAHLVGPYAAIVVLACAGAALSLSGTEDELTYGRAVMYVGVRVMVAIVLTVAIAELMHGVVPWAKPKVTLIPLAFAIGWIKDYGSIRSWLGGIVDRLATRRADGDQ